jgi:hypothetical protein
MQGVQNPKVALQAQAVSPLRSRPVTFTGCCYSPCIPENPCHLHNAIVRTSIAFHRNVMAPSGKSPVFRILARKGIRIVRDFLQQPEILVVFVDVALQILPSVCKIAAPLECLDVSSGTQNFIQQRSGVDLIAPILVLPHPSFDDQITGSL